MDKETIDQKTWRLANAVEGRVIVPFSRAVSSMGFKKLCKLVELTAIEEREACAVVAEEEGHYMCEDAQDTAKGIADLIRARSEP